MTIERTYDYTIHYTDGYDLHGQVISTDQIEDVRSQIAEGALVSRSQVSFERIRPTYLYRASTTAIIYGILLALILFAVILSADGNPF